MENEEKYKSIKSEILGDSDDDESGSDENDGEDDEDDEEGMQTLTFSTHTN